MKKNSIIAAVVVLSATLFSCTKESLNQPSVFKTTPTPVMPAQVKIVSDWLSLSFSFASNSGAPSLQGVYMLNSPVKYDYNDHVQLAFVRRSARGYIYDKLPMNVSTSLGNAQLTFALDHTSFTVNISNTDFPDQQPAAKQFEKMEYRFIVIPKSTYQGLNIDWNDYAAVAAALNF